MSNEQELRALLEDVERTLRRAVVDERPLTCNYMQAFESYDRAVDKALARIERARMAGVVDKVVPA